MKLKQQIKKVLSFVLNPKETLIANKYTTDTTILSNEEHIRLACNWLLLSQEKSGDDGYSRQYSLFNKKWDRGYIETTGYIIPSLIEAGKKLNEKKYIDSALKAGEWLLKIQNNDGSFSDIDEGSPQVFDTGQCLIGFNYLYEYTKENKYLEAIQKTTNWLIDIQEENGSWVKFAYNSISHSYYSRVAAALFKAGIILDNENIKNSALKQVKWVLDNQFENGYFNYCEFERDVDAVLHTIIYVLEGLLDIYDFTKDKKVLEAVLKNVNKLKEINLNRDLILCSQYDKNFNCTNDEKCITGLAQWAGVLLRLYKIEKNEDYKKLAIRTIHYLKSKHIKEGENLKGALPGSVLFYGYYGSCSFMNWNNKFFIDTLLMYDKYEISLEYEQEIYSGACFSFLKGVVTNDLTSMDKKYLKQFDNFFEKFKNQKYTILDLGCGKGKFLNHFKINYINWKVIGVEPNYTDKQNNILSGSAYKIPLPDNSVDIVYIVEVLQHIKYLDTAFSEIRRVLNRGGYVVIGDRNPYSWLGLLKPLLEKKGKWMYPKDSAYKEQWYNISQWQDIFKQNGVNFISYKVINSDDNYKGIYFFNRYYFMVGKLNGKS